MAASPQFYRLRQQAIARRLQQLEASSREPLATKPAKSTKPASKT